MNTTHTQQTEQTEQNLIAVPARIDSNECDITKEWQARELFLRSNKNIKLEEKLIHYNNLIKSKAKFYYTLKEELLESSRKIAHEIFVGGLTAARIKIIFNNYIPETSEIKEDLLLNNFLSNMSLGNNYRIGRIFAEHFPSYREKIIYRIIDIIINGYNCQSVKFLIKNFNGEFPQDELLKILIEKRMYKPASLIIKAGATFSKCSEDLLKRAKRKYKFGIRSAIEHFEREQKIKKD